MTVEVSVVIVTYNSSRWVAPCFESLSEGLGGRRTEVIVVDNASTDGTADLVAALDPSLTVVTNATNTGFAAAVNQGVRLSNGHWVLLLNPDTVLRPGCLDSLVSFAEHNPANGLYGGRTLQADGTVELSSCWALPTLWSTVCFALGLTGQFAHSRFFDPESIGWWKRDSVREVGMITGCLLLTRRSVWDELDGMNERYFVYGEDADFAARARRAGYRPIVTPKAVLMHAIGASSTDPGAKMTLLLAGKITYIDTQWCGLRRSAGLALLRWGTGMHALASRLSGRGRRWQAAWSSRQQWWYGYPERSSTAS